jgi:hypothetical protein
MTIHDDSSSTTFAEIVLDIHNKKAQALEKTRRRKKHRSVVLTGGRKYDSPVLSTDSSIEQTQSKIKVDRFREKVFFYREQEICNWHCNMLWGYLEDDPYLGKAKIQPLERSPASDDLSIASIKLSESSSKLRRVTLGGLGEIGDFRKALPFTVAVICDLMLEIVEYGVFHFELANQYCAYENEQVSFGLLLDRAIKIPWGSELNPKILAECRWHLGQFNSWMVEASSIKKCYDRNFKHIMWLQYWLGERQGQVVQSTDVKKTPRELYESIGMQGAIQGVDESQYSLRVTSLKDNSMVLQCSHRTNLVAIPDLLATVCKALEEAVPLLNEIEQNKCRILDESDLMRVNKQVRVLGYVQEDFQQVVKALYRRAIFWLVSDLGLTDSRRTSLEKQSIRAFNSKRGGAQAHWWRMGKLISRITRVSKELESVDRAIAL